MYKNSALSVKNPLRLSSLSLERPSPDKKAITRVNGEAFYLLSFALLLTVISLHLFFNYELFWLIRFSSPYSPSQHKQTSRGALVKW